MKSPIMKRLDTLVFSSAHTDLHDLLALCKSFLHWLGIWQLTFIVPWGETVMLTQTCFIRSQLTFMDLLSAKNLWGCHILDLMTLLSWTNYRGFVSMGSKNRIFTSSNWNPFGFLGWTDRKTHEMWYIIYKSICDYVWNPIQTLSMCGLKSD